MSPAPRSGGNGKPISKRDGKPLHHLVDSRADGVAADYTLLISQGHQLYGARALVLGERVIHWIESGLKHLDLITVLRARLLFGQSDRT